MMHQRFLTQAFGHGPGDTACSVVGVGSPADFDRQGVVVVDDPVSGRGQHTCWGEGVVFLGGTPTGGTARLCWSACSCRSVWWGGALATGVGWLWCAGRTGSAADSVDGEAGGATQLVGDGSEGGVGSPGEVTTCNRG